MASYLISSSHHVDFDSVFGMDDAALVQMFESLVATRLKEFLGCPAVFYEAALIEFFTNGSVREDGMLVSTIRGTTVEISETVFYEAALIEFFTNGSVREDGMLVSTIRGTTVEISESMFAASFDLPTVDLMDLSDVPKNLVFDARSLLSESKEQDMVTPGTRQAKGFAIQISFLLKNVPGLDLGESRAFPIPRVITGKTVHRFVAINEKKRPAVGVEAAPMVKKKRTTKGKPVVIAQEAPVEQPPLPTRKSQKRKRRLILSAVDETVDTPTDKPDAAVETTVDENLASEVESTVVKQTAIMVAPATGVQEPVNENVERVVEPVPESVEQPAVIPGVEAATDDPDAIIEQVLDQLDSVAANQDSGDQPTAQLMKQYLDEGNLELPVGSETDAMVGTDVGIQQEQSFDENTSRTDAEDYLVEESDEELVPETENPSADEAIFDAHDRTYRVLFNNVRHDMRDHKNLLSLDLKSYQQKVSIQVGAAALDTVDIRREVKEMNAKVDILSSRLDDVKKDVEATKEAISHQLLEFQSQAQANHIVLTDQLGQLVDYINRGGNAKKGEGESSRGPQPPHAVQIRDSGNAGGSGDVVRTTEITQTDIDAANRQIMERMMREDRERERERRSKSRSE
ncbi:hypothetical protein F511_22992 [Dorcoceras hygrometricum]|uniref:Dystroglycan-like n=1 Tax=Dorcoceras hygrometricum TaxID=472368 RepID=A0A2Z7BBX1_9LAMI|nr:hypothetical protein F511_22992 [Dorcoceras hygrometricum]